MKSGNDKFISTYTGLIANRTRYISTPPSLAGQILPYPFRSMGRPKTGPCQAVSCICFVEFPHISGPAVNPGSRLRRAAPGGFVRMAIGCCPAKAQHEWPRALTYRQGIPPDAALKGPNFGGREVYGPAGAEQ